MSKCKFFLKNWAFLVAQLRFFFVIFFGIQAAVLLNQGFVENVDDRR